MSYQMSFSRHVLERISDRKKRRLAIDMSDPILSDADPAAYTPLDSPVKVIEDSQSSLKGHRDLFGELIPRDNCKSTLLPENKSMKKTLGSKKKKIPYKDITMISPIKRPTRLFIPTPRIMRIMKDAQTELYSLMGLNKSSSEVSVVSNNSLDISGVHNLLNCSETNELLNENSDTNLRPPILEGVVAFVDYKLDNDRSGIGIIHLLGKLGAQVEKTFNRKVTHVVFRDGYRKTYNKAMERKIPLVSARWVENCQYANKILDPTEYPPIDIEKYTKPREYNYNISKSLKKYDKYLREIDNYHDELFGIKCDKLMNTSTNYNKNCFYDIDQNKSPKDNVKKPKKPETIKESDDPHKINDIISILSDQLCKVLNTNSPIPDEQTNELYFPVSIKILRKYLTPKGGENKTPTELDSDIVKIEDRLNLNIHARKRLRKLLFPSDVELHNISTNSDFPSPSPPKIRISAPARLISTNKRKLQDKNLLIKNKNIINEEKTTPKKMVSQNVLQWRIPTDLRPKKAKQILQNKTNANTKTLSQTTMPNMFSRNSSMIFQTPNNSVTSPVVLQSIACTGMTKCEIDTIELCIQNLGTSTYHTKVEPSTTYLVTKQKPNRTLNMIFAMAFGCIIVSEDWVHESYKVGKWLHHENYLIPNLSKPVKEFQIRRQTFGKYLTFHIFDDAGNIYVSNTCQPPAKHLRRLVRVCGGKCTSIETMADVVVGYTSRMYNNVNEKWILDCVTEGSLINISSYALPNNNIT